MLGWKELDRPGTNQSPRTDWLVRRGNAPWGVFARCCCMCQECKALRTPDSGPFSGLCALRAVLRDEVMSVHGTKNSLAYCSLSHRTSPKLCIPLLYGNLFCVQASARAHGPHPCTNWGSGHRCQPADVLVTAFVRVSTSRL